MKYKSKPDFLRRYHTQDLPDPRQEMLQRFPLDFYQIYSRMI